MGQTSGKFVIPHIQTSNKQQNASASPNAAPETASQLVNGDASVMSNVPAIDDVVESVPTDARTEDIQAVDNGDGPNGTVHGAEGQNEVPRKKSTPLEWLKRRLSKKSVTSKENATEDANTQPAPQATEGTPEDQELKDKAKSLVDEAINEVTAVQEQNTTEVKIPAPEIPEVTKEEPQAVLNLESVVETGSPDIPTEPHVETEQSQDTVASTNVEPETTTQEPGVKDVEQDIVLDTNNTNVMSEVDQVKPTDTDDIHEAVSSKLNELDLTNGHPEDLPSEVINAEGGEGNFAMNGQ